MIKIGGVSTYHLRDVWETLSSFSKYFLSNTFSQYIYIFNCSVAFSLLFSILIEWLKRITICNDVLNYAIQYTPT